MNSSEEDAAFDQLIGLGMAIYVIVWVILPFVIVLSEQFRIYAILAYFAMTAFAVYCALKISEPCEGYLGERKR